jgi:hypothetical protein
MTHRPPARLLILLVLLQSGVAAGHAHDHHGHAAGPGHPGVPHAHARHLLDLLPFDAGDEDDHDTNGGHDEDALYLPALTVAGWLPAADAVGLDLPPASPDPVPAGVADTLPFPLGLPPPTAGPPPPLYLTLCCLRN